MSTVGLPDIVTTPSATVMPGTLRRGMRLSGTLLITLSIITPASSVFIIVPGILATAGSGAFLSMGLAGLVGVFMAYVYAELSSAYPVAGGEYTIVGRIVGPLMGFIVLGVMLVANLLSLAILALGLSTYLAALAPGLPAPPTAMAALGLATIVGILNIRTNAIVTGLFLVVELVALAVLVALGCLHVTRPLSELVLHPVLLGGGTLSPAPWAAIGMASSVAIYAYNGFGSAVYFGEETHEAERHIARAILWSLAIAVATELIPLTAVLMGAPDLKSFLAADNMFGQFITTRAGHAVNDWISLGVALAIFNALIAGLLMNARLVYSTGRDHVWPMAVSRALTLTHRRYHSPWVATLACGLLAAASCLIDQTVLLVVTGTGLTLVYAALCLASLLGRRNGRLAHGSYRMPGFPFAPVAALLVMLYVVYANWLDPAIGRPSLFATAGIVAASALYYALVLRRRGEWVLHGPSDSLP